MYWRHVVASTLDEREEFVSEGVNNSNYQTKHSTMIFEEGFSFSGFERDKLWLKSADGSWFDASNISGADDENDGRALVLADFDDDGDVDFFVHNIQRERHRLYRNDVGAATGNGWLKVRLEGVNGHPSAAGAVVRAEFGGRKLARILALGSGFLSQNAPEMVFGLGDAAEASLEVDWPGGATESFGKVASGSRVRLVEGSGKAIPFPAHSFVFADPAHPGLQIHRGDKVAVLPLENADGSAFELDPEASEKPLLINFWATYCIPCVAELGDLQALHAKGEWRVVLIGMDPPEDRQRAEALLAEKGVRLDHYYYTDALIADTLDPERMPLPTSLFLSEGRLQDVLQAPIHDWSGWDWGGKGKPQE